MPPQQQGQFMNHDERGPRSSREARQAARAAKNGNSHYRRAHSPDQDDFAFSGGEEPRSPASDVALQDAILAQAQAHQVCFGFCVYVALSNSVVFSNESFPSVSREVAAVRPSANHQEALPTATAKDLL